MEYLKEPGQRVLDSDTYENMVLQLSKIKYGRKPFL